MSSQSHNPSSDIKSYVAGFILSLIFTLIPYYLVVNQSITGTTLLVTIIGFAMIQMIIQITFFLHLGRGPKPNWNLFFFASTVVIILIVVSGSIMIMNNLHYNMIPSDQSKRLIGDEAIYQIGGQKTGACQELQDNHTVTIKNGKVFPEHTDANKCDTMTFVNQDSQIREMAFGKHPYHDVYAGETELLVRKGRGKTVTLSESGSYKFHDHLDPDTAGSFTVNP